MVDELRSFFDDAENVTIKVFATIAVFVAGYVLRTSTRFIARKVSSNERRIVNFSRIFAAVLFFTSAGIILLIWFSASNAMIIALIGIGVIVFLSMKDLVTDVFAFLYVTSQSTFKVGDRIEVEELRGEIYQIGVLTTQVTEIEGWLETAQPTGRIVSFPNSKLFTSALATAKKDFPFVWRDITLPIEHDDNLEKAEEILQLAGERELAHLLAAANSEVDEDTSDEDKLTREKLENQAGVFNSTAAPKVSVEVDGFGIDLTLRFLCRYDDIAGASTRVWKDVHAQVQKATDVHYSPATIRLAKGIATE